MKKILLSLSAIVMMLCASCSGSKEPSQLLGITDELNADLKELSEEALMVFNSMTATYADGTVTVNIEFADKSYCADDFTEALVQFIVSQYLKEHTGEKLDTFVNTLTKEKGNLVINLMSPGQKKEFVIPAARVVKLVKLKPMELSYNDARTNIMDIMAKRCNAFAAEVKAQKAEFTVVSSFAQYTFTFEKSAPYARMTPAQLNSAILKCVKPVYEELDDLDSFVIDLLKTFKIDGYRFVYENEKDKYVLKSAVPWRIIK